MSVWMVGIDHNQANLDIRSAFSLTKMRTEEAYERFGELPGVRGSVILVTCNRTEWWISVTGGAVFSPKRELCAFLGLDTDEYAGYLTQRQGTQAVNHLFHLAAGLESKIMGEDQILTQVGEALQTARLAYASDNTLEVLFRLAITAGKRVKTETVLTNADSSVIHTALRELEKTGFHVAGKRCMVIGNGMMGKLSAQALMDAGADVTVTVRQYTSGIVDIPRSCKRINYTQRYELLPSCDLVVSATSSPNYTLCTQKMMALETNHPICLIDLAVPRDMEREIGNLPQFTLYDIDSFQIDLRSESLQQNMHKAEEILAEEAGEFYHWYEARSVVPRISTLKEAAGRDVQARLSPAYRRAHLQPEQKDALSREVEGAVERMMNHLLFGLHARLSGSVFSECMEAMEFVFSEEGE